jgi:catechol 2,3-dioxygenase-like lactoylglutathione lyase family enzyme
MLAQCPLIAFIPTTNAARARLFYENILGLRFVSDDPFALVMEANGTMIRITRVENFTPAPFTILGWKVDDIHHTATEMIGKGVQFARYGFLEQTPEGIWTSPDGTKVAWFPDPDGNVLSISQHT